MANVKTYNGLFQAIVLLDKIMEKLKDEDKDVDVIVNVFQDFTMATEGFHLASTITTSAGPRKLNIAGIPEAYVHDHHWQLIIADNEGYHDETKAPKAGVEIHTFSDVDQAAERAVNWLTGRKLITWPDHTLRRSETKDL